MLRLIPAALQDAQILTAISKAAFDDDTARFMDADVPGPPGYDSVETTEYMISNCHTYNVVLDATTVGGAVMYAEDGKQIIGRIFLSPDSQGKGLGRELMRLLEEKYRDSGTLYLDTPKANRRTNRFYESCGYSVYRQDAFLNYYSKTL